MAAKGGGAWKVAYADFVTAMMAFFLVMWICGQDQEIKRAVSYYFSDPFADSKSGSKKPSKTGAVSELPNSGRVPMEHSVAVGRGRNSYTPTDDFSAVTKMVSDWIHANKTIYGYWSEQAKRQREAAGGLKNFGEGVEKTAARQLAKQLKDEIAREVAPHGNSLYQSLLYDSISGVNWMEIAEDLLGR